MKIAEIMCVCMYACVMHVYVLSLKIKHGGESKKIFQ